MMFAGKLIYVALRRRIGDIQTGLREGVRCPYVGEGTATAIGHPQAGILCVPAIRRVGIAAVRIVVRVHAGPVFVNDTATTEKADIVDKRIFAGLPKSGDCE